MAAAATPKAKYPKVGAKAPAFSCAGSNGKTVKLSGFKGKKAVVLYFYPEDDTPGCTTQACGFRDHYVEVQERNAVVLGVSPDGVKSHQRFKTKFDLPFTLLADEDHAIAEAYGVWGEKSFAGKKYMGINRSTFVIDADGNVTSVMHDVKPATHADEVLAALGAE